MNAIQAEITAIKADLYDTICDLQTLQAEYKACTEKLAKAQQWLKTSGDKLKAKCKELETPERLHVVAEGKPRPAFDGAELEREI